MDAKSNRCYTLAEVKAFGATLIQTEDLDPVYVALYKASLPDAQLKRLLLAYFFFYSLGGAAKLSEAEGRDFWHEVKIAAANEQPIDGQPTERFPRGAERRHFRGQKCIDAVSALAVLGKPEQLIERLLLPVDQSDSLAAHVVMERVKAWPMCGEWIAFKAADIIERVLGVAITFPDDILFYKEPRAALDLLPGEPWQNTQELIRYFGSNSAPPRYERGCNVQEVETCCCKWKSSLGGNYWIGKDIKEIRHGLEGWGATAAQLLAAAPKEVVIEGLLL